MSKPDFESRFHPEVADGIRAATAALGFSKLLGIRVDAVEAGRIVCCLPVRPELHSGVGALHGGALASLVDHTLSLVVYPLVEPGSWVATMEFKVNYLGAVREGELRATGQVLSLRRRTAVARVEVENDGELVAVAQGTLSIQDKPGTAGAAS